MRLRTLLGGIVAGAISAGGSALAADLTGVWLVGDRSAQIQIDTCGGSLWGVVVWEREPGNDEANPDPSLRGRPTLGMPILLGLRPSAQQGWQGAEPGVWRGHVYNAKNGETYEVNIRLARQDVLHLEGCVLGGMFCGGQDWTRAAAPPVQVNSSGRRNAPKPSSAVCSRISNVAGRAH
jgi:uncharacterized protein (DUF2147 family)